MTANSLVLDGTVKEAFEGVREAITKAESIKTTPAGLLRNVLTGLAVGAALTYQTDESRDITAQLISQGMLAGIVGVSSVGMRELYHTIRLGIPPHLASRYVPQKTTPNDIAFLVGEAIGMGIGHAERIIPAIQKYF